MEGPLDLSETPGPLTGEVQGSREKGTVELGSPVGVGHRVTTLILKRDPTFGLQLHCQGTGCLAVALL